MLAVQVLVNALVLGCLYACIAIGFSLVWGVLNVINLIHGSFIVLGAYLAWATYQWFGIAPWYSLVIAAPLRGAGWLAGNGPSNTSDHRRALLTVDGHGYLAQRFAIDWIQFGKNGELGTGKGTENRDYSSYGAEVLAVASGRVVGLKDGIIENKPESLAVPITYETVAGNFISLDLGNGRYAHYAHLQPGSLRVKVGDRVKTGQVLGLLGNSGNSDAPHLHFQITDGPSFLASEGVPYVLPSFAEEGSGPEFHFKPASTPATWRNQLPVEGMVVRFPQ